MKKIHIFGLALLMAMVGACKKNQNQDTSSFSASIEIDENNKTYLDGMKVRWSAGDQIIVYGNGDSQTYTLSQGANTQTGTFTTTGGVQPANTYRAFYPSTSCTSVSGDVFTFTMPATQTYTATGFMNNLNPMAGKNDGNGGTLIGFKNAFAIAKFSTTGNRSVSKIELEVPAGNYVSGTFTFDYGTGTTTRTSGGGQIITLNCASPVALDASTPTNFYFVLPPGSINNGFTVWYYQPNSNTPFTTKTVSAGTPGLALARNTIKTINLTAEVPVQYVHNLLPELATDGSGWAFDKIDYCQPNYAPSHYSSETVRPSGNVFVIQTSTNQLEGYVKSANAISYTNGHQYYVRWMSRKEANTTLNGTTFNGSFTAFTQDVFWPIDANYQWINLWGGSGTILWETNSHIFTHRATGSDQFRFDINNLTWVMHHYCFADAMLIDLTADYANQGFSIPTKAQLDAKPYFFGQREITSISGSSW